MKRLVGAIIILAGALVLAASPLLPGHAGRFAYAVDILDPRPAADSTMPPGLKQMGAVRLVVLAPPQGQAGPAVILAPDLQRLFQSKDLSVGKLPENGRPRAVAGSDTRLRLGDPAPAGIPLKVSARLAPVGPIFDSAVVVPQSEATQKKLVAAGWSAHAHYLIPTPSWEDWRATVARLTEEPSLLPDPATEVLEPEHRPLLPRPVRFALAGGLAVIGLVVMAFQLRGLTREQINERFRRDGSA